MGGDEVLVTDVPAWALSFGASARATMLSSAPVQSTVPGKEAVQVLRSPA